MPTNPKRDLSEEALRCLHAVAGALHYDDDLAAGRYFTATWKTLQGEERLRLRDMINEELLAGKEKEISAHGIRRSFRFWSRDEKAGLIRFAKEVIDALDEAMGLKAVIGYGTALAVARSNDLIPHDDDVDLICVVPVEKYRTFKAAIDAISETFAGRSDLKTYGNFVGHLKFGRSPLSLDVFIAIQEGGFVSSIPGPRKTISIKDILPARTIELFGVEIAAPRDQEAYLSKVYGKNWRTPDPIFGHNWGTDKFTDLIESR